MTEKQIKEKVKKKLEKEKWVAWFPPNVRFYRRDIFGIADCVCWKKDEMLLIQFTSYDNRKAREKKILDFLKKHKLKIPPNVYVEVWSVKKNQEEFDILPL